jgi:hypothetical protein
MREAANFVTVNRRGLCHGPLPHMDGVGIEVPNLDQESNKSPRQSKWFMTLREGQSTQAAGLWGRSRNSGTSSGTTRNISAAVHAAIGPARNIPIGRRIVIASKWRWNASAARAWDEAPRPLEPRAADDPTCPSACRRSLRRWRRRLRCGLTCRGSGWPRRR